MSCAFGLNEPLPQGTGYRSGCQQDTGYRSGCRSGSYKVRIAPLARTLFGSVLPKKTKQNSPDKFERKYLAKLTKISNKNEKNKKLTVCLKKL